ncbi:MAG: L-histidine N(alpha)-methyltransferase [Syntrophobacteraceae bacterium]|nr:L-histidine N(alpha)-methyltransferase [Syntrophobacteraceae bacterium]
MMLSDKVEKKYEVIEPCIPHSFNRSFAMDILEGLSQTPRRIPSVYLYDKKGSELFQRITALDAYYLTRSEQEILTSCKEEISESLADQSFNLIELGSGDGSKTLSLIECFMKKQFQFEFIPLDISPESVNGLTLSLEEMFSTDLKVTGIIAEYFDGLKWLANRNASRNLTLFLGSNIGNMDRQAARRFLRCLWDCLSPGDQLLIGFDLKKDIEVLNRAYNDPEGITREFNLNVLDRINRELGGEFDREEFVFYGSYQVTTSAVESYLVSKKKQEVFVRDLDAVFSFEAWEPIHTESSYKYLEKEISCLAEETGFEVRKDFFDKRRYFVDSLWKVIKPATIEPRFSSRFRGHRQA